MRVSATTILIRVSYMSIYIDGYNTEVTHAIASYFQSQRKLRVKLSPPFF